MEIGKPDRDLIKLVKVGGQDFLIPMAMEITIALVISHYENDIGPPGAINTLCPVCF